MGSAYVKIHADIVAGYSYREYEYNDENPHLLLPVASSAEI
jgi:hypothetical protein